MLYFNSLCFSDNASISVLLKFLYIFITLSLPYGYPLPINIFLYESVIGIAFYLPETIRFKPSDHGAVGASS
ncbi:hypothetical protein BJP41_08470 [Candidatus Williamhamiltonella defendens]|uniref:Uncharacterized protein n=1 Tax=Candidatus Williamhamiltonella defendens TaxID=138072 RepID=A0A2D3T481_9ENTR|nr:hypothetical protein CJJ18_08295 [Candidatus Hamiltonella defensa]ATW30341.1 hypothetical protein BJP41_08470 [Candidatus Hamiltonella defensa]AWK16934.1 hypothetical protein CCS40_08100 [Candidatus Hamiltonella defensa]